jgi:hypothetical protein
MSADSAKKSFGLRGTALAALTVVVFWGSAPARAYNPILGGGGPVSWRTGSPFQIWDDTNKILKWTFYTGNFPKGNWPPEEDCGGAIQNATQTITDVSGKLLTFQRLADTANAPANRDNVVTFAFVANENSDFYGSDISGANAVTYVDDQAGIMMDVHGNAQNHNDLRFGAGDVPRTIRRVLGRHARTLGLKPVG